MKKTLLMQGFFLIYAMQYVKVIINKKVKSLDHDFVYEVPPEWMGLVRIGSVVSVPFGQRTEKGIVVGYAEPSEEYHIKYIDGILNEEFLFPLLGTGAKYGQSVSKTIFSNGMTSTASFSFFAILGT